MKILKATKIRNKKWNITISITEYFYTALDGFGKSVLIPKFQKKRGRILAADYCHLIVWPIFGDYGIIPKKVRFKSVKENHSVPENLTCTVVFKDIMDEGQFILFGTG